MEYDFHKENNGSREISDLKFLQYPFLKTGRSIHIICVQFMLKTTLTQSCTRTHTHNSTHAHTKRSMLRYLSQAELFHQ